MQLSVWQLHPGSADRLAVGPKSRNAGTDRVRKAPSKSPFSRATRAVAVLLVACAALFANAPAAQAQTSTEVWSATLTVGTNGDAPYIFYGWNDFNSYAGASLSDQDFTSKGTATTWTRCGRNRGPRTLVSWQGFGLRDGGLRMTSG